MSKKIDLFEDFENLPENVKQLINDFHTRSEELEIDGYENCKILVSELELIGYSCEYYLDAEPFNLKKVDNQSESVFKEYMRVLKSVKAEEAKCKRFGQGYFYNKNKFYASEKRLQELQKKEHELASRFTPEDAKKWENEFGEEFTYND